MDIFSKINNVIISRELNSRKSIISLLCGAEGAWRGASNLPVASVPETRLLTTYLASLLDK